MQLIVAKLKEKDPAVAASVSKIELMVSPFTAHMLPTPPVNTSFMCIAACVLL